jgi:hypothetical protein
MYVCGVEGATIDVFKAVDGMLDGESGRFHTQTECISRVIEFDSKQKNKHVCMLGFWFVVTISTLPQ